MGAPVSWYFMQPMDRHIIQVYCQAGVYSFGGAAWRSAAPLSV